MKNIASDVSATSTSVQKDASIWRAPQLSMRWWPVFLRNLLVWRKLAIPSLVGNIAEHIVAVQMAYQNKMDLSLGIAVGSGLQIALFVTPVLIGVSVLLGTPMSLVFNQYELAALVGASLIAAMISVDGESNWLEGAQLLGLYLMLGIAFFFA